MEAVAHALPVPVGRPSVPELLGDPRRFRRRDLVPGGRGPIVLVPLVQGYVADPPAPTGLLVDVYG